MAMDDRVRPRKFGAKVIRSSIRSSAEEVSQFVLGNVAVSPSKNILYGPASSSPYFQDPQESCLHIRMYDIKEVFTKYL